MQSFLTLWTNLPKCKCLFMSDLDQDLAKKFVNFLDKKQYERLQFEAEMLGDVENQHPLIMFYYASSIYLKDTSKKNISCFRYCKIWNKKRRTTFRQRWIRKNIYFEKNFSPNGNHRSYGVFIRQNERHQN